jgi:hypothetical protein
MVANTLAPIVPVAAAAGQYKKFSDENSFRAYSTQRGLGGSARRIEFDAEDDTYNCQPQALEATVDDHERDLVGAAANPLASELLDQGKIRALVNAAAMSHAKKVVDFVLANTTAVAQRGNWSSESVDPIDQLDEQLETLSTDVGSTENISLVLSTNAWRVLRSHPKVKARTNGVQVAGISPEQMTGLLMFPVKAVVGAVSSLTSGTGQTTKTKANIIGANALLIYSVPNPTIYDPSAFKCFTTGSGMVDVVRTYREEKVRGDVHAIDWSEDLKSTSSVCVKRLAIS